MKRLTATTRRRFLRTSGNSVIALSLVDLLPTLSSHADEGGADCSAYASGDSTCQNAGDEDEACGGDQTLPGLNATQHDADQGCTDGSVRGVTNDQPDSGCGEQDSQNHNDPDNHCNPFPGESNQDASCEQTGDNTLDNFDEHNDPNAMIT